MKSAIGWRLIRDCSIHLSMPWLTPWLYMLKCSHVSTIVLWHDFIFVKSCRIWQNPPAIDTVGITVDLRLLRNLKLPQIYAFIIFILIYFDQHSHESLYHSNGSNLWFSIRTSNVCVCVFAPALALRFLPAWIVSSSSVKRVRCLRKWRWSSKQPSRRSTPTSQAFEPRWTGFELAKGLPRATDKEWWRDTAINQYSMTCTCLARFHRMQRIGGGVEDAGCDFEPRAGEERLQSCRLEWCLSCTERWMHAAGSLGHREYDAISWYATDSFDGFDCFPLILYLAGV